MQFKWVRTELGKIVNHCRWIWCTCGSTIYCIHQWGHDANNVFKYQLSNIIKFLIWCRFIINFNNVPVIAGDQYRPIYSLFYYLISGLWSVWYTRFPGLAQHNGKLLSITYYMLDITIFYVPVLIIIFIGNICLYPALHRYFMWVF